MSRCLDEGLTGTVETIEHGTGKPRARVRLDAASTGQARYYTPVPDAATEHVVRVSLNCLIPQ